MLNISEYFTSAIEGDELKWKIKLRFARTKNALQTNYVELTDDDILENTISIESSSTSNSYFTVGGVCSRKLTFTLSAVGIAKLREANLLTKGVCIKIDTWLKTNDPNQSDEDYSLNISGVENTTGKCKLGYYYIYDIENSDFQCKIDAYDAMLKFDTEISTTMGFSFQSGPRTIFEWLELICIQVSTDDDEITVASGVAESLINNTQLFNVDNSGDLQTYRTALGYLSILAGGFLEIDRDNHLTVSYYKSVKCYETTHKQVTEYKLDENTYTVVSVSTVTAGFKYKSVPIAPQGNNQIGIYFDENLFLRGIQTKDTTELDNSVITCIDNIREKLYGYRFTGGDFEFRNRPDLELGDNITVNVRTIEVNSDGSRSIVDKSYNNVIVTRHIWNYLSYSQITSNNFTEQTTNGNSSSFKTTDSGGGGGGGSATNAVYSYTGVRDINIKSGNSAKVFEILFILNKNIASHVAVMVISNIKQIGEIEAGNVVFRIYHNNAEYYCRPKWTVRRGYFTFSFDFAIQPADEDMQHSLVIHMDASGVDVELKAFDYQILVNANGIATPVDPWTGRYELMDTVSSVNVGFDAPIKAINPSVSEPSVIFD